MMAADAGSGIHLDDAVAVIGLACRFPGAPDADAFWRLLIEQRDAVTSMPEDRFDRAAFDDRRPGDPQMIAVRRGGFLPDVDRFDAAFFGISPREAEAIDPQHRLLLETAWEAIEDAGLTRDRVRGTSTGVFAGMWTSDYERIAAARGDVDLFAATGTGRYAAAGRLSYAFDLRGPSLTVDTACSSSLVALHLACQSLRAGESELAIVGAANLILDPLISVAYSRSGLLSKDGRCRFAAADASGYVRSEGVAVLVLQRAAAAAREGNRIRATVIGSAVNNDGAASGSLVTPSIEGQTAVVRAALAAARVPPGRIQYIEAHGTGTRAGDPVELAALAAALGPSRDRPCPVGSVKANIGHTEAAAGLAGLIKVVLALEHGIVPASLMVTRPTEDFDWAACLRPCVAATPLDVSPAIAAVSSYGITGTNAHAILCQAVTAPPAPPAARTSHLVPVSSHSASALEALVEDWQRHAWTGGELSDIAFTAGLRRTHRRYRRAVVADDVDELTARLAAAPPASAEPPTAAPVFVFSGHGSQWAGMGRGLLAHEPVAAEALEACARAVRACGGPPIVDLVTRADQATLSEIGVVQPLLFALQVALARTWISWGVQPGACIGHSMGEVAAAHIAGILTLEDAARIICARSALLATRRGRGAMALIDSPAPEVERLIAPYGGRLSIAAINDAHATVVSGEHDAVAHLLTAVESCGGFCRRVHVDVAAHSAQVDDLVGELERALAATRPAPADCPFYSTVSGDRFESACDAGYWARNLRAPVQFSSALHAALRDGFRAFVEISPHPIAAASVLQEARDQGVAACVVSSLRRDCDDRRSLLEAAAELFNAGHDLNWAAIAPTGGRVVSLPPPRWDRSRFWLDRRISGGLPSDRAGVDTRVAGRPAPPGIFAFAWEDAPATEARRLPGRSLLVDDAGLAGALVIAAENDGLAIEVVSAERCADSLAAADVFSDVVLALPEFASCRDAEWAAVEPAVLRSIEVVRSVARRLTELAVPPRLWLLTTNALGAVRGAAVDAVNTGLAALFRVILDEHPELAGGIVDCTGRLDADGAATIVRHLRESNAPREVVIAGPQRLVRRLAELQPERRDVMPVRPEATYLLTGGFGGLGIAIAERLVERGARHLALAGRSALPPRADWHGLDPTSETGRRVAAVRALESRGAVVHVLTADVGDAAEIATALNALATVAPPVMGIVHAAAVVHDGLALECPLHAFTAVLRAKGGGAWNLLRHYSDAALDFFVCCSSVGSIVGLTGQASYAAANGLLDGLACGGPRSQALSSVNWGVWQETGLQTTSRGARETAVTLERAGLGAFDRLGGLNAFETVVAAAVPQAAVFTLDRPRLAQSELEARLWLRVDSAAESAPTPSRGALRRQLDAAPAAERHRVLGGELRLHLSRVLRIAGEKIPAGAPLGSLGLESLMALELQRNLEHLLDERLPKTLVWRSPTLEALTDHLLTRLFPDAVDRAPSSRSTPRAPAMTERDALTALLMPREGR